MTKRNVVILSAPLTGARPLAEAFVKDGWYAGDKSLASRIDPSVSSFENESMVKANQVILQPAKENLKWNYVVENNWVSIFDRAKITPLSPVWADRVMMAFHKSPHAPYVLKDSQLVFTHNLWMPFMAPLGEFDGMPLPVFVVLFRFPTDFIASVMDGVDKNFWPDVPKDPDYLAKVWIAYYQAIINQDVGHFNYFQFTDQLTTLPPGAKLICSHVPGIARLNRLTGAELKPFSPSGIKHRINRDSASIPKGMWDLYNRLYWKTMQHEEVPVEHDHTTRGQEGSHAEA